MSEIDVRTANRNDVPAIVAMLADDPLGATRESPDDLTPYYTAFEAIDVDPNQQLIVVDAGEEVVGTMQLTIIPGLSHRGASRCQIEAVRVREDHRNSGLGSDMIRWAIDVAVKRKCAMIQFTTNKARADAHRFYERLGFQQTHLGYKMDLRTR